ncbi:MAG: hypothetical protein LC808_36235 [Actinobacteria bacterium]|nr:hypothetical protein [Actinomycetota bacterium]
MAELLNDHGGETEARSLAAAARATFDALGSVKESARAAALTGQGVV